jgi:hypothetical protein
MMRRSLSLTFSYHGSTDNVYKQSFAPFGFIIFLEVLNRLNCAISRYLALQNRCGLLFSCTDTVPYS